MILAKKDDTVAFFGHSMGCQYSLLLVTTTCILLNIWNSPRYNQALWALLFVYYT